GGHYALRQESGSGFVRFVEDRTLGDTQHSTTQYLTRRRLLKKSDSSGLPTVCGSTRHSA
ncbi:MAG: hypothetical protein ACLQVD_16665, partial [Capsulimonadaceae bacterium]